MKKLTSEDIDRLESIMLDDITFWEEMDKDAEKMLVYIAGIHDMANRVRRAIKELGGH